MSRDNSNKLSKREQVKHSNKKTDINLKKKKNEDSDSDNGIDSESESDEMDIHEFRKYVQKIFPSKHLTNKIKAGEKIKKIMDDEVEEEVSPKKSNKKGVKKSEQKVTSKKRTSNKKSEEEEWETSSECEEEEPIKKNKKNRNKSKSKKTKKDKRNESDDDYVSTSDDDDDDDSDYEDEDCEEEDDDDDDSDYEDEDYEEENIKPSKYNIIFTIGGTDEYEDEDEWDDYDSDYEDEDNITEDEDEEVSSDESDEEEEEVKDKKKKVKDKKKKEEEIEEVKSKKISKQEVQKENNNEELNGVLTKLKELLSTNPKDKSIKKCIKTYEEDLKKMQKKQEKKNKKQKAKNMRIFRKIISDKNTMNDFSFYEKLELENQHKLIKELREINKITRIEKPYRITLLESNIPVQFKAAAMKKINSLRYMEPGSGEFYKIKNWVDTFMKIPFTDYRELPISIEDGVEKCHEFMENSQKILDEAVYGLNDAKMQIMQMLGQLLTNPKAIGTAIAIHGPPGTGKTSLVKEGISKILNRPFAFIALGGATDSSFLEGHGYTYEGSTWGKIVQILVDSKCMNPVIYFDELDKISDTPRGEEIAGILTHLTDTTQNSQFHDKYFSEINFDLSKCLFIFSYNDETKVNPILKDRMYRIKTKGYSCKEKTVIANNYLLPKIREQVKFISDEIIIPDDVLVYINDNYCNKEDGVRNMKRCLEIIYTKLNLYRLMKPDTNLFEGEIALKVEFPFNVTKEIVEKLIKRESDGLEIWRNMYL
jgi:ATP-dependent Lon protease